MLYLDAMGGDNAPHEIIKGALLASGKISRPIALVGKPDIISSTLKSYGAEKKFEIIEADEVIEMEEEPATAVRKKKKSSIVVGCTIIKEDEESAFISAGSTGALLSAALLYTGRIKGIQRPGMGVLLPADRPVFLIDTGANADCKPEYLFQFARMGSEYLKAVLNVDDPKIALLNIGTEAAKGNMFYKETFEYLSKKLPGFAGNIESKDVLSGVADIVVCDGFTGNIFLKAIEGAFLFTFSAIKETMVSSFKNKIAASLLSKDFKALKNKFDPSSLGGVPFLGVKGCVIKAHGNSNDYAIMNAIKQADNFIEHEVLKKIKEIV